MAKKPKRTKKAVDVSPAVPAGSAVTTAMKVNANKLATPEGFSFTSGAVLQPRDFQIPRAPKRGDLSDKEYAAARKRYEEAKARREKLLLNAQCMVPKKRSKNGRVTFGKPSGKRCGGKLSWDAKGNPVCDGPVFRDPKCAPSRSVPCATSRFSRKDLCPVQLTWLDGKPVLRLCEGQGKPGQLVRVKDPADAMAQASKLCAAWAKGGKSWAAATKKLDKARDAGFGKARKSRSRKRTKKS